jgi:hypothetical protein
LLAPIIEAEFTRGVTAIIEGDDDAALVALAVNGNLAASLDCAQVITNQSAI